MATDIGTATMTDVSTAVMPPLNALDVELANHIAGISEINVKNQPAPNGKGKYSVQIELGTIFKNRNWLGSRIIANKKKNYADNYSCDFSAHFVLSMYG